MTKIAFEKIRAGLEDALEYAQGNTEGHRTHVPEAVDVAAIRKRRGLSQAEFALRYGFSKSRVRDWEQGRSNIDAPSRILLTVIDKEPEAIERALAAA